MGLIINKYNDMTPFDMTEKPSKQYPFLLPLIWGGSWFLTRQFHLKIEKHNMRGLKPPYLVIATHQGPVDYYVGPLALFPHRAMYVSDMEGYAAFGKWLYRGLGCIGKRRYVSDFTVVKNIKYALSVGQSVVIYPESRHSNVGTTAYIPKNMGKLAKILGVPIVILKASGNYLANPFWDEEHTRKVPVKVEMTCICDRKQLSMTDEVNLQKMIEEGLAYDEYRYQQENHILIRNPKRAEGLHKALYQCRNCGEKYHMVSENASLACNSCHASWTLTEDGFLAGKDKRTHIPDWYEWQRSNAATEFSAHPYRDFHIQVYALPNEKGFVDLGKGKLLLNKSEFTLNYGETVLHFPHSTRESVQTEYNYKGTGMCIILSTMDCCYYIYSDDADFNPTELQFIGEYLFQQNNVNTLTRK